MAVVTAQRPDALSISGNLKDFVLQNSTAVKFVLKTGGSTILEETYYPGNGNIIRISLQEVVEKYLSVEIPSGNNLAQSNAAREFTAEYDNQSYTFRCLLCGVDNFAETPANFLRRKFLTWQPREKEITYYSPEYITFYATEDCSLKLRAYFEDGTQQTLTLISSSLAKAGTVWTQNTQYAVIAGLLGNKYPGAYDVWTENTAGVQLAYTQRYIASPARSQYENWYLFVNSLGGIDCVRAYGEDSYAPEYEHQVAEVNGESLEYRVDTDRLHTRDTGRLTKDEALWLQDFFVSRQKMHHTPHGFRQIVVTESDASISTSDVPGRYSFTYKYANETPYLNITQAELPKDLVIKSPNTDELFFLPPRLAEFDKLPVDKDLLLPANDPHGNRWGSVVLGNLYKAIINEIVNQLEGIDITGSGGGGIYHIKLNDETIPSDENAFTSLRTINEIEKEIKKLDDFFLRKDKDGEIVKGYIRFLKQLFIGTNVIDSLTDGAGIIMDNGRMQADRLELRHSLSVLELIFNRFYAQEGDYSYSESGTIEHLEKIGENTYNLTLRKRWEFDFTAFRANDIVYGIVNDLASGSGEYYTSWFRIININTTANTLTVILYPDNEVPGGKNYPPTELMTITRRGNLLDEERQGYWYISSREKCICMLDGVDKPVLEESNYSILIGRLKHLSIFDNLPINYLHTYVYARGIAIQDILRIDYHGKQIKEEIFRGKWSVAVASGEEPYRNTTTAVHVVYHLGCKWMCVTDNTLLEPKWNSTGWALIEGNSDLSCELYPANGEYFYAADVDFLLHWDVKVGHMNINEDIIAGDVEWVRDSGDVVADNLWAVKQIGKHNDIHITNDDIGTNFDESGVTFKVKIYVRDQDFGVREVNDFFTV